MPSFDMYTLPHISIPPNKKNLFLCKKLPFEIIRGIINDDKDLFFTYIKGESFQMYLCTIFATVTALYQPRQSEDTGEMPI
jgi:hypothetical protein